MTSSAIESWLRIARDEGVVPAGATVLDLPSRPWPVVLLTALGAWLAAIPLLLVVGMLFGDVFSRGAGIHVIGALMTAGAAVVLRSRGVPLFVEQLAVPALVAGIGASGVGLFRDAGTQGGAALLGAVCLGVAVVLRAPWLRVLLGAAAMALFGLAWAAHDGLFELHRSRTNGWTSIHAMLVPWLLAHVVLQQHLLRGRVAAALESTVAVGWGLALLAMLAWWSGMTFLVGGAVGGMAGEVAREVGSRVHAAAGMHAQQAVSFVLALAGGVVAGRRWPGLRHPALVGAGLVLATLAALMPSLGAVLLMLALLATSGRPRLAVAGGVAAAWIVGAFYYELAWPLATKAIVMAAAGALLLGLAQWALRQGAGHAGSRAVSAGAGASARSVRDARSAPAPGPSSALGTGRALGRTPERALGRARAGIVLGVVAVLIVANTGIVQKEQLIRDGRPVFVELAPADPRSLMQGDFMRLDFAIPGGVEQRRSGLLRLDRPRVVAQIDQRGVATRLRADHGEPLLEHELAIELTPKNGRWTLVTDAWFFAEGGAARWQRARYGEFRVDAHGRALLVGLRGAKLESL